MQKYQDNIKNFTWFRILFTTRFYYPIYTILFLDMGITIEQFALLNTLWAVVIIIAEVPSGAFADTWGRKKLLVLTSVLMIIELGALLICPVGKTMWLIPAMIVNRVCSGLAEAAASGADEALAYDSLILLKKENEWQNVLAKTSRFSSGIMLIAMVLGGVVYDQKIMGGLFSKEQIIKAPLLLTFIGAILCFIVSLKFTEPELLGSEKNNNINSDESLKNKISKSLKLTMETGSWILKTPVVLIAMIYGLCFDNCIRMFMTLGSQYNKAVGIPISMMGIVGGAMAFLGVFTPSVAKYLIEKFSFKTNMKILFVFSMISFYFISKTYYLFGIIPSLVLGSSFFILNFMLSYYLNKFADSDKRATILSFKGLSFNIAYGLMGVMYAAYIKNLRVSINAEEVFAKGLSGFVYYLPLTFILTLIITNLISSSHKKKCTELEKA